MSPGGTDSSPILYSDIDWAYGTSGVAQELVIANLADQPLFKTFCLERNEGFTAGIPYEVYDVSNVADLGGVGGPDPDPISNATASLYVSYRNSTLDTDVGGYTYDSDSSAVALQQAIWAIEEEIAVSDLSGLALSIYNAFTAPVGALNDYAGSEVVVINTWTANHTLVQSFLDFQSEIEEPVPEPASMLIWGLGLGVMGTFGFRRRRRTSVN